MGVLAALVGFEPTTRPRKAAFPTKLQNPLFPHNLYFLAHGGAALLGALDGTDDATGGVLPATALNPLNSLDGS